MNDAQSRDNPAPDTAVELLFRPFHGGGLVLRNRLVMSPMTRARSPCGIPGPDVVAYYRRRARSGLALLITEGTYIDHKGAQAYPNVPQFHGPAALDGWRAVLEAVHAEGAAMMPQLWHTGIERRLGMPPDPTVPGYGPSAILRDGQTLVTEMTRQDIAEVTDSYRRGAATAQRLGFDGAAIHAGHGYLLDRFFWTGSNHRTDHYGGSLENRMRFAVEVVRAMRAETGPDFPIMFRFSQWKAEDYDAMTVETPEELAILTRALAEAGVTIFDVSTRRFWQPAFPGDPRSLAAWTRHLTGRTVMAVGSIGLDAPHQSKYYRTADNIAAAVTDLSGVVEAMARGDFDLAAIGRAVLADPAWAEKVRSGAFTEILPYDRHALETYQ